MRSLHVKWKSTLRGKQTQVNVAQANYTSNEYFALRKDLWQQKTWHYSELKVGQKNWLLVSARYLRRSVTIFVQAFCRNIILYR